MSTLEQQMHALNTISQLVMQHFPYESEDLITIRLMRWICHRESQTIVYDQEKKMYVLVEGPQCRVCGKGENLTEIPTKVGSFYICEHCRKEIASPVAQVI